MFVVVDDGRRRLTMNRNFFLEKRFCFGFVFVRHWHSFKF
jgi:hypothetical protein